MVYVGDGGRRILVRALNQLEPVTIATGSLLRNPFVSPDGQWVAYSEGFGLGALWKVPIGGGPAVTIATRGPSSEARSGWTTTPSCSATATDPPACGACRRTEARRKCSRLPTPARNEYDHYWPVALPDGRGVLYTVLARSGGLGAARDRGLRLRKPNGPPICFTGGTNAVYLRSGHLAYVAGETLWAVPFDAERRAIIGTAVPVVKLSAVTGTGGGNFAVSATGTLAYAHAPGYDPFARTLSWIDRNGKMEPLGAPQHPYMQLRFPTTVRASSTPPAGRPTTIPGCWTSHASRSRVFEPRRHGIRSRRGATTITGSCSRRIVPATTARRSGVKPRMERASRSLVGSAALYAVVTPDGMQARLPAQASPSRQHGHHGDGARRLAARESARANAIHRYRRGNFTGRTLARVSSRTVSGRPEVWVRPYPDTASGRWQVSTAGGNGAEWRRDGRELFYLALDGSLMGVQVKDTGSRWTATSPVKVLEPGYWSREALIGPRYDVSPDGKRFLVVTPPSDQGEPPDLVVIQHWDEELKAHVPSK